MAAQEDTRTDSDSVTGDRQPCILVISDIHYAGDPEQARRNHEARAIGNPILRSLVGLYRRHYWMRDPFAHNELLDDFISSPEEPDLVVANGDYSLDTAFVGVSDPGAFASAQLCLGKLRGRFGDRLLATIGDHELGKMSVFGGCGGLRLESLRRVTGDLGLAPFWRFDFGRHVLMGVTSSLVALPLFRPEVLPTEWEEWQELRLGHLRDIREAFRSLELDRRILLFCHDPSALPFLAEEDQVRRRLDQIEATIIGHLHSPFVYWQSRVLAGMPRLGFLGNTARRMSDALRRARDWRPFRIRLCPALAGIELLKDGGYLRVCLDEEGRNPAGFNRVSIPRRRRSCVGG